MPCAYEFVDENAFAGAASGALRYRLRQIDTDGRETLSPVLTVLRDAPALPLAIESVHPLPARDRVWITVRSSDASPVAISLQDASGRELLRSQAGIVRGAGVISLDISALPAGLYRVLLHSAAQRAWHSILKQ